MRATLLTVCLLSVPALAHAQSVELMPGTQRLFADVQVFEGRPVGPVLLSVFSRTRATVTYENQTNLFSGLYANVTSPWKVGASLVGAVRQDGAGLDAGVHFVHQTPDLTVFALVSLELSELGRDLGGSFFGIARYNPVISGDWRFYASLELYSLVRGQAGHVASVERVRLGASYDAWSFGAGLNASQLGPGFAPSWNPGLFVRLAL